MAIPSGVILFWPGLNSTSHTGWSRDTAFDDLYPYVTQSDDAGGNIGNASHTHTTNAHTHTYSITAATGTTDWIDTLSIYLKGYFQAALSHTHSGTSGSGTEVLSSATNQPQFTRIIFKTSSGSNDIPAGFYAFTDLDTTLPAGWSVVTTRNYDLLRGATTGGNGGAQGGDSLGAHQHTTSGTHSHAAANSGAASGSSVGQRRQNGSSAARYQHTHNVTLNAAAGGGTTSGGEMPPYETLILAENTSGGEKEAFAGLIAMWKSTEASIPAGWAKKTLTATQYYAACCDNDALILGYTGGGSAHSHTTNAHSSHTGTINSESAGTQGGDTGGSLVQVSGYGHSHSVSSVQSVSPTVNYCASGDAYPLSIKVLLIRYSGAAAVVPLRTLIGVGL